MNVAVFFDLGQTLVEPRVDDGRLTALTTYPFVPEILRRLRRRDPRQGTTAVGLMSNTGQETADSLTQLLQAAGLADLVDPALCLFSSVQGLDKTDPAFFARGSQRAELPPHNCVFVGEDAAERSIAAAAGFVVSPHPLHALHLIETGMSRL